MKEFFVRSRKFRVRFTGRYRRAAGQKIPMYRAVWREDE